MDIQQAKRAATALQRDLDGRGAPLTRSAALEVVAHQLGHRDWNTASAALGPGGLGAAVPVLRVQDGALALDFYTTALGFTTRWEHRFEPGLPLYARVARGACVLDLSEHFGDGTPGTVVWIPVPDVRALRAELLPRLAPRQRPGLDQDAPGGPTMTVLDPFSNVLRFCQA